jgi:N utilization substance protein B
MNQTEQQQQRAQARPNNNRAVFAQRREGRVAAMQYLYAWGMNKPGNLAEDLRGFFEAREKPREHYAFAEEVINGVIENLADIDAHIKGLAQNWEFERIARIDLAILRVAIFEMTRRKDIPPVVSINEAIDLSKQFSNADSKRFINGILDRLKDQLGRDARKAG